MKATSIHEERTERIVFDPIKFSKTATRLANEKASRLEMQLLIHRAIIIALLGVIAWMI